MSRRGKGKCLTRQQWAAYLQPLAAENDQCQQHLEHCAACREAVLANSDLFSLGSMLYAMLTGHPPFRASDPMAVMNRICHERHRSLVSTHPEIPLEVSRMVDKLLAQEPRRRFHSAEELREHLQDLAHSPLRLKSARRWPGVVRWLTVAAVLIVMGCLAVVLLSDRQARDHFTNDYANRRSSASPSVAQSSAATSGFADLSALDVSLQVLDQRVDRLSREFVATSAGSESRLGLPTQRVDQQLQQVDQLLNELELEFSSTAAEGVGRHGP